ncbi:MAG: hypothetical protein K0R65_348 [Crocinitomicaceae bacterium]|nr:hypothetical protein [Crocinitomicaceae bacterium]
MKFSDFSLAISKKVLTLPSQLARNINKFVAPDALQLAHGVTGNTSDFGSEESRFEP